MTTTTAESTGYRPALLDAFTCSRCGNRVDADEPTRRIHNTFHRDLEGGCRCPGCDPRGAAEHERELYDRIAELESRVRAVVRERDEPARERNRVRSVLQALADADEPFVTGTAEDSSGQSMAAESARAVAWWAAQAMLGEATDGRPVEIARSDAP